MFIDNNKYSIKNINLNTIDKKFIDISYKYLKQYPNKWYDFIYKIICNKKISYFKDTTAIIQISLLDIHNTENLFVLLKKYLNEKIIIKIIYKKEFVIIHFNENFHMDLIKNYIMLDSINTYKNIIKNFNYKAKCYFYNIMLFGNIEKIIPIVLKYNNNFYIFDNNPNYKTDLDNLEVIYFFRNKKIGYQNYKCIQIYDNANRILDNLYKIL